MKGIIFTESNFDLTVQGIKTQTRRIIKSRTGFFQVCSKNGIVTDIWQTDANGWCGDNLIPVNPRYKVGETVYLKEPYIITGQTYEYEYLHENKTDIACIKRNGGYKNKLFMPEIAARYFIKITNVRAERLQDISHEDCIKEGITYEMAYMYNGWYPSYNDPDSGGYPDYKTAYSVLIDEINGKGTWDSNPWVWVYDYGLTGKELEYE